MASLFPCPSHCPLFDYIDTIWRRLQITTLLLIQIHPNCCYIHFGRNTFPGTLFSYTLSLSLYCTTCYNAYFLRLSKIQEIKSRTLISSSWTTLKIKAVSWSETSLPVWQFTLHTVSEPLESSSKSVWNPEISNESSPYHNSLTEVMCSIEHCHPVAVVQDTVVLAAFPMIYLDINVINNQHSYVYN